MSRIYDNWERLVGAAIKREQFRQMALAPPSRESSFSSRQSDLTSFASSNRHDELGGDTVDNLLKRDVLESGPDQNTTSQFVLQPSTNKRVDLFSSVVVLPGIEGFQIIGSAKPGSKLLACGYPVNGTSLCMFQWVRYHTDGSVQYLKEAQNPEYLVTADDLHKRIAVECVPMNDQGRQGDIVRVFANNFNRVVCGKEMKDNIEAYLSKGMATFNVLILMRKSSSSEKWEPATLVTEKYSGFQVMVERKQHVLIAEKYSVNMSITIPDQVSTEFLLKCANGTSYYFRSTSNSYFRSTSNRMRDTIVLTMRAFKNKALDDRKKKARFLK